MALLEVSDLRVGFDGGVSALRGVSFSLGPAERLAVLGETGAGKSTLAHCIVGLVGAPQASGSICLDGAEIVGASDDQLRGLRWSKVAILLQGTPFNPVVTVQAQISEPMRAKAGMSQDAAQRRALELAQEVRLDPMLLDRYPHQLSGGERRRASLAMVLALEPELVILDEPFAGLDPETKVDLLAAIARIAAHRELALIVISHDVPAASELAPRTMVMYAGDVIEEGQTRQVVDAPAHPYTSALLAGYPVMSTAKELRPIRGEPPDPRAVPDGCAFHPRCTQAEAVCAAERPRLAASRGRRVACHFGGLKTLLEARSLHKSFGSRRHRTAALVDVSLIVREGESVGVLGPSGSGKTTLARILAGHLAADRGEVHLEGSPLPQSWRGPERARRRRIQLIAQDPWEALSPRLTVAELAREPLDIAKGLAAGEADSSVSRILSAVGLPPGGAFLTQRIHELSGGQLQRITLARALLAEPKVLIADEPTSMLDPSEQARVLVVLRELQVEMGLALVFVSHDLAVVRKVTDRVVVLDQGQLVERRRAERFSVAPRSDAGRRLLAAAPRFPPGDEEA